MSRIAAVWRAVRGWLGAAAWTLLARLIAWPLLWLALRRMPTRAEIVRFRQAFCDSTTRMPALLRGLGTLSAVRDHFDDLLNPKLHAMPPVLFLHIEKTAGCSVIDYLAAQFPPEAIDPDPFHGAPGHLLCPVPADKRPYGFIWGHQDLPSYLRCQPPRRFVVTFLREPHRRLVSLYRYWCALTPEEIARSEQHAGVLAARARGFRDFLDSPEPDVGDFIDNIAARRLTGHYLSHVPPGGTAVPDRDLESAALSALDRIDFVGIAERMGDSLQRLAVLTGIDPPRIVPRRNVLATMQLESGEVFGTAPRLRLGAAETARLDYLTRIDRTLYAAALARLGLPG